VKLTVVGCAGSYPTPESPGSCYLVEHDDVALVLDLGNGALGGLQGFLDPLDDSRLAAVVLSHCHIDHCVDLGSLYVMRRYGPVAPREPLRVLGPLDTPERMVGIYGSASLADLTEILDFRALTETAQVGPFEVTAIRARHPVEAYSLRVSAGGRSLTYSGDTGPNPGLARLASGTDIALFEASFVGDGNPSDLHMSGADAGRIAAEADVGLLVLTHQVAWNDPETPVREAAEHFSGPIERARAGMTVTV